MYMSEAVKFLADRGLSDPNGPGSHTYPSGACQEKLVVTPRNGGYPRIVIDSVAGRHVDWMVAFYPGSVSYPEPEEAVRLFRAHADQPVCGGAAYCGPCCKYMSGGCAL